MTTKVELRFLRPTQVARYLVYVSSVTAHNGTFAYVAVHKAPNTANAQLQYASIVYGVNGTALQLADTIFFCIDTFVARPRLSGTRPIVPTHNRCINNSVHIHLG